MNGVQILQWILYADDAVLFCNTPEEAKELLSIINTTCSRFGLTISFTKTKTQVFHDDELAQKDTLFSVENHVIENVREFVYLGQVFTNDPEKSYTDHRIARATAKFNELRKALCDTNVNLQTRRKLLEACVRSRLTYGLQACYPKEAEMKKLQSCWNGFLRSMVKGGWRRRKTDDENEEEFSFFFTNERIQELIRSVPLRDFVDAHT